LGSIDAGSSQSVYEAAKRIDWREHLAPGATLACDCSGGNESIRHTIYGAQLLKDAVCDNLRDSTGERPNIKPDRPDVLLHLHVEGATGLISLDFSGESLHRRGYRLEGGRAPLKENVAAAVLLRAGWPHVAEQGGMLLDPMCGSGTFLTEGALIAADAAPSFDRDYFGFKGWRGFDAALWERLLNEARARRTARVARRCILGYDIDADAVRMAIANSMQAGVAEWLHVEKRSLAELARPNGPAGLIVVNPPYGERIGAESGLPALYSELGTVLRERFAGWQAAILTGNPPLARNLGVYAKRTHRVFNGTIECRLLRFDLNEASAPRKCSRIGCARTCNAWVPGPNASASSAIASMTRTCRNTPSPSISMAANPGTCTSRNMPRRRPSMRRAPASAAARRLRCCRKCWGCRFLRCIPGCASRKRVPSNTKNAPALPSGWSSARED
jgi:23S rRNA (guanine2445-N2)-methyltransferase / 23S rRNA (guanine2069-N7)-methyltransferase